MKPEVNDKFRYTPPAGTLQTITIPQGLYDVESFGDMITTLLSTTDIEFILDNSTGGTKHILLNGYTVSFDLADTFAKTLGTKTISGTGFSAMLVDLWRGKSIDIAISILTGTGLYLKGQP